MTVKTIYYTTKNTAANTTYCSLKPDDYSWLMSKLLQLQSYMGELAITKHRELQDVHRWWTKSNKQLPFNRVLKRNNSPQSLISGIVNNIMYGDQYDFSEVQLVHLQNIISNCTQLINVIEEEYNIQIQKSADHDSVMFMQEYFE